MKDPRLERGSAADRGAMPLVALKAGSPPVAEEGQVGFCCSGDGLLDVWFPKAYENVEDGNPAGSWGLPEGILLHEVLARARTDWTYGYTDPRSAGGEKSPLESAVALRRDFKENGLYREKRMSLSENDYSAPVQWSRTMKRYPPSLGRHGIRFTGTLHSRRKWDRLNFLHRAHATCINRILMEAGDRERIPAVHLLTDRQFSDFRARAGGILETLLGRTFRIRGRKLIGLMMGLLGGHKPVDGQSGENVFRNTKNFEDVWENIVRDVLGTENVEKLRLERGSWLSKDGPRKQTDPPRMDALRVGKGVTMIIDAKDKRVQGGERSGTSDDHYKQIIYRNLFDNGERVVNVLVFPSLNTRGRLLRLLGMHRWDRLGEKSIVYEMAMNYEKAARHWLGHTGEPVNTETDEMIGEMLALGAE